MKPIKVSLRYCTGHINVSTATFTHVFTKSSHISIYRHGTGVTHDDLLWISILGHYHDSHGDKINPTLPN